MLPHRGSGCVGIVGEVLMMDQVRTKDGEGSPEGCRIRLSDLVRSRTGIGVDHFVARGKDYHPGPLEESQGSSAHGRGYGCNPRIHPGILWDEEIPGSMVTATHVYEAALDRNFRITSNVVPLTHDLFIG